MDDPVKLLDNVINYLKYQREIYGDFDVTSEQPDSQTSEEKQSPDVQEEQTGSPQVEQQAEADQNPQYETTSGEPNPSYEYEPEPDYDIQTAEADDQDSLFDGSTSENIYDRVKSCSTLEELHELCKEAEELYTDLEGTNLVFGVGNPRADLMIIGEAPGYYEDQQGEPFVGKAGQLLNKILKAINFERADVYIANILKHRPPDNRNPLPEERQRSLPFLMKQMELIDPKLVLCLGRVSANTLLDNNQSMRNMRGSIIQWKGREMMVTYHPAALLRNPKWKRATWEDVQLLRERYDELDGTP